MGLKKEILLFPEGDLAVERKPFLALRKAYHVAASSLVPLLYWNPPFGWDTAAARQHLLEAVGGAFLFFFVLDWFRLRDGEFNHRVMRWFSTLLRHTEKDRFNGATFLTLAFFLVIFLFPRPVAVAAMLFLSLGDAAAELCGRHFGRLKVLGRSLEGTLAFFLVSFAVAWTLLDDWRVAFVGALAGSLVELFSFKVDDNLTVPLGSAAALYAAFLFFTPL